MDINKNLTSIVEKGELTLFRTIWNLSKDNMFIVRKEDNRFISEKMNQALRDVFNLSEKQSSEIFLDEFLDENMYKKISEKYNQCIEKNEIFTYEESHILNDSKPRYWNTTIIPIIDNQENITRIFGISKEITQLKRINETLELEVKKRTKELEVAVAELKQVSITDKLTGVYNRHHLDCVLEDTAKIINRYENNYGVIILDLDKFKEINDTFGHHAGDIVLQEFSKLLKDSVRESDIVGRWGGDEFLLLIPFIDKDSIEILANHIKETINKYKFSFVDKLTASLGATLIKKDDTEESLISRADHALYKAKEEGKNKVEILL
ncbi:hypothetical protein GCM10012288_23340 [Malaciobacter pacificus]|uniref:diguanylate cyclase n=1 Tax=Malaciobacter pacificus TaxID=1080223 RepID=A0A5C2H7Z3_9BACT|nr:sensor domain-containing diguanylate cyclase [Malaciobacter pacificus]QEP35057.1 diguanylate cyclase [Malaciobacter pacificus]GGD48462.1 hypothetical protein GCM10012288_23340 [Malaciobacter pacificus]